MRVERGDSLPERGWHTLRHIFGTHAAMFGMNPWRLMTWMGHKHIEETLRYVHVAGAHAREVPASILAAGQNEPDPDQRVLKMLGARATVALRHKDGTTAQIEERRLEAM